MSVPLGMDTLATTTKLPLAGITGLGGVALARVK